MLVTCDFPSTDVLGFKHFDAIRERSRIESFHFSDWLGWGLGLSILRSWSRVSLRLLNRPCVHGLLVHRPRIHRRLVCSLLHRSRIHGLLHRSRIHGLLIRWPRIPTRLINGLLIHRPLIPIGLIHRSLIRWPRLSGNLPRNLRVSLDYLLCAALNHLRSLHWNGLRLLCLLHSLRSLLSHCLHRSALLLTPERIRCLGRHSGASLHPHSTIGLRLLWNGWKRLLIMR